MMVKQAISKAKEEIQHPGWASIAVVLLTLILGCSEWVTTSGLERPGEILELQNFASLLKYISPVGIAAITRGFIK